MRKLGLRGIKLVEDHTAGVVGLPLGPHYLVLPHPKYTTLVMEPKFLCPRHTEAKQTRTWEFGAQIDLLQGLSKNRWLVLERPELPNCFQARAFTGCWREFPGGPVVRTPRSHCRGLGSIPGQGTKIPQAAWCGQINK